MSPSRAYAQLLLWSIAAVLGQIAVAQELEIAISPTPVGSGARAAGMADAFVAIADDATAASWNPAGLVQLERPELSLVWSYNGLSERLYADFHPEVDSEHSDSNNDLNYLSFVYPLPSLVLGRNASVSLNYQRKYDLSRNLSVDYNTASASAGAIINAFQRLDFKQEGGLSTLTPAFAMELTHRLSLGVSVNLWWDSLLADNQWTQETNREQTSLVGPTVFVSKSTQQEKFSDFSGENLTLGALWSMTDRWSLGVRYDSSLEAKTEYRSQGAAYRLRLPSPDFSTPLLSVTPTRINETRRVRFPASVAVGVAYRRNDRQTYSLDITRTDWNGFYFKTEEGRRFSLVDGSDLDTTLPTSYFKPTTTVRFGVEHVFVPKAPDEALDRLWTVRGGLFLDEEPANGSPDRFYGFTAGVGLLANQRINTDIAYQLRTGNNVNSDLIRGIRGFHEDVVQHRVVLSTVIYF